MYRILLWPDVSPSGTDDDIQESLNGDRKSAGKSRAPLRDSVLFRARP
jgi:hypothetical protein